MSDTRPLRDTAELFVKLAADAGRTLEYDESGVRWAAQYVDTIRPVDREDQRNVQAALVGSFLGEALIAVFGGAWEQAPGGEWSVALPGGVTAHPFRATLRHLEVGAEESIVQLFEGVAERTAGDGGRGTGDGGNGTASAEDPTAVLRETAERFREVVERVGGPAEYGEAMVAFVDEYLSNAPPIEPELRAQHTALIGAVLGESLVAAYAGEWRRDGASWAVHLPRGAAVYPFAAARQRIEEPGASLLAVFHEAAG